MKRFLPLLFLIIASNVFSQSNPKREFRAAWITTVFNRDWPSKAGLGGEQIKQEFIDILEMHKKNNMNAVIVQIRPSADAFYPSPFEPWSKYLTGAIGKAPAFDFDPLEFMVQECKKRALEFHAWLNPYRALMDTSYIHQLPANHIMLQKPEWFVTYGNKMYFDPAIPAVREFVTKVVSDVVRRYDIDAVHFDDYFYPYKIAGVDFPDTASFRQFNMGYPEDKKDDWRRLNVDLIIQMLHDSIKAQKPYVKFGISPFGIYRNKKQDPDGSETDGLSNYDDLYADILKWMKNDWIDYVAPQLYWYIGLKVADYKVLVDWWSRHSYGKPIYIGQGIYRVDPESSYEAWKNPSEIPNQIRLNRKYPEIHGSAYFTTYTFDKNPLGVVDSLRNDFYRNPALIPITEGLRGNQAIPPTGLSKSRIRNELMVSWEEGGSNNADEVPAYYVIYKYKGKNPGSIKDAEALYRTVGEPYLHIKRKRALFRRKYTLLITSVNRFHEENPNGRSIVVRMKKKD